MIFIICMIPLLLFSFGLIYIYYTYCHPWVSEEVSVGFEPEDNEIWKPELEQMKGYGPTEVKC